MAQSNNKSNVRAMPPFWQNDTVASPIPWVDWSNIFHLAIIAKEIVDNENQPNLSERHHPRPPTQKISTENELKVQRKTKIERSIQDQKRYDEEEAVCIKTETKKFNGIRIKEADKKLHSILYLALGNEGKRFFGQKSQR